MKRLNSYDFFTSLVPGALFTWYLAQMHGIVLTDPGWKAVSIVYTVFLWYFAGLAINRIGVVIEQILQAAEFVKHVKYERYIAASKKDPKLQVLSEKNNTYRSMTALCLAAAVTEAAFGMAGMAPYFMARTIASLVGTVIFAWSQRTQSEYIVKRVEDAESGDGTC